VLCRFPNLSSDEVEAMIEIADVRQTRVYKEGRKVGKEEGRQEARIDVATRLLARDFPVSDIAEMTGLTVAQIRKLKKNGTG
jgi:predicted transposase/invertase (TIGR01784 family)